MQNIDQTTFIELSNSGNYSILDVRRPDECASGIVPGATIINYLDGALFQSEIAKLDTSKHYLIYCRSGNRSGQACMMMDAMGFSNTYNLLGGMMTWTGPIE